eukprot:1675159-Alexandrium_andersonii.AAC.1
MCPSVLEVQATLWLAPGPSVTVPAFKSFPAKCTDGHQSAFKDSGRCEAPRGRPGRGSRVNCAAEE